MSKDNRVFLKKVRVIFIYCLKPTSIGVHKNIIYQHICMTKYIYPSGPVSPLNAFRVIFFDFSFTVKVAPHECVIRTGQP